jgi:tetratricopeptide (TPR) repeat protein
MIRTTQTATLAALLMMPFAVAAAQNKGKCDINDSRPYQLNSAKTYLSHAESPNGKPDEKPKHLRNGVQVLTDNPQKIDNQVGREFLLARLMLNWQHLDKGVETRKRSEIGYSQDPDGTVDMLATADSAFHQVETLAPECADSMAKFRQFEGNTLLHTAVENFNDGLVDTAAYLSRRALVILPRSAIAYNVLALVAQQKKDYTTAIRYYDSAATSAGEDTTAQIVHTKHNALLIAAQLSFNAGLVDTTQTSKAADMKQAVAFYQRYMKEVPTDASAQAALAQALGQVGDTAAVSRIFAEMLESPDKYTDEQLYEAGTSALSNKRYDDAIKLLDESVEKNPYGRDGLANLAAAYFNSGQGEKMQPIATRLLHVDSLNPDSWKVVIAAYQTRVKALDPKNTAAKKVLQDSLIEATKIFTDGLPVRVKVQRFTRQGARFSAIGEISLVPPATTAEAAPVKATPCPKGKTCPKPVAAAPATAAGTPTTVKVKFQFLDATGKVLVNRTITVGPIDPGSSKDFSINGTQTGVVAYRYDLVP